MAKEHSASIHLGLVIHNHQPVGNFPWVFQQVYEESYLPMIQALELHPQVRLSLHYTGSLLDWFHEAHPEFVERIAMLVRRNQVELVSGGFYGAGIPFIPVRDKNGQNRPLHYRAFSDFGVNASGMWFAGRMSAPGLPHSVLD